MLHDVRFHKGDYTAWLEVHDIDVHVMCHVIGIDKSGGGPSATRIRHFNDCRFVVMADEGLWCFDAVDGLVGLADPVERDRYVGNIAERPIGICWNVDIGPRV